MDVIIPRIIFLPSIFPKEGHEEEGPFSSEFYHIPGLLVSGWQGLLLRSLPNRDISPTLSKIVVILKYANAWTDRVLLRRQSSCPNLRCVSSQGDQTTSQMSFQTSTLQSQKIPNLYCLSNSICGHLWATQYSKLALLPTKLGTPVLYRSGCCPTERTTKKVETQVEASWASLGGGVC